MLVYQGVSHNGNSHIIGRVRQFLAHLSPFRCLAKALIFGNISESTWAIQLLHDYIYINWICICM